MKSETEPLWTKNYILTIIISLLVGSAISMLMTTLPMYAKALGAGNTVSGLVVGIYAFTALLCRPFIGGLLDNRGRKVVLLSGICILSVVFLLYNFTASIHVLLVLRLIQGIGFSAYSTSTSTLAADFVPRSRISEGIGYFSITLTLPTAFGPSIGLMLIDRYGYRTLFTVSLILAAVGLLTAFFVKRPPENFTKTVADVSSRNLIEKTSLPECGVMICIAMGLGGIITFIPQMGQERSIGGIGLYFTVYAAALILSRLFSGRIADKTGPLPVVIPGIGLITGAFLLLAFARNLEQCLISAALFGLGFGIVQPVMNAAVIRKCPPSRKGAASATFSAAMDVGMGFGSIVWGGISQNFGFFYVYMLCAFLAACALPVFLFFQQRSKISSPNLDN